MKTENTSRLIELSPWLVSIAGIILLGVINLSISNQTSNLKGVIEENEIKIELLSEERDEKESKIQSLQKSNASLQEERDDIHDDYAILRDKLWNINNNFEKESTE